MKSIGTLCFITVSFLFGGCDPGITIHQVHSSSNASGLITIEVRKQHPLVGNTWYVPQVTVTNRSDSAVSITSAELVTKGGTYANKPRQNGSYPLELLPGKAETLDLWFDLTDDVKQTFFRQAAELRVHYRSHGQDEIAQVSVIGGPLDTSSP